METGPKLATLDWPPPPSPARADGLHRGHATGSRDRAGWAFGASSTLGGAARAEAEREFIKATWRPAEIKARADLWALRADIDREKLRIVAPYPFFGCLMRFQDDFAALQIAEDGRFSFSDVCLEAPGTADAEEDPEKKIDRKQRQRVITYEGVLEGTPAPSQGEDESQATSKDGKDQPSDKVDPEVAAIEGRALVRHEIEESGGQSRLVAVERGTFRFIITVSPFFQPSHASVQLLVRPRSPGRPPPRTRRLPYVGTGLPVKKSSMQKRTFGKKLIPRLKGSGSTSVLLPSWNSALREGPSSPSHSAFEGDLTTRSPLSRRPLPRLNQSSSAPNFATQKMPPARDTSPLPPQVTDWKDFYRQRADMVLAAGARR